jgi:hypothetical protein
MFKRVSFDLRKAVFVASYLVASHWCLTGAIAQSIQIPVYGVFELTLTAAGNYSSPYLQMPGDNTTPGFVVGTFTGPNGEKVVIDGFWDGGSTWKIRMAPTAVGTWTYSTSSSDTGLNGKVGSFTAVSSNSKGFIRVDPNRKHQFMWSDGTPFQMKPAAMSIHAGKSGGGIFNYGGWMSDGSFQQYVDTRVSQGFNAMYWGMVISKWGLNTGNTQFNEGGQPFLNMNLSNPINPAYFQAADRRMVYALSKGLIPQFGIVWPDSLPSGWTTQAGKRLWRYVIARYAAYNVTWNLFGEGHEWNSDTVLNDWGNLTKKWDPYGHPTSFHTSNETGVQAQSWMDYLNFQLVTGDLLTPVTSSWSLNKPIVYAEYYGYDDALGTGFGATPDEIRVKVWSIRTSGAFPVYETWGTNLNTEAVGYVKNLWSFYDKTSWWSLAPAQSLVNRGLMLADVGREYVVYLETGGTVTVNLTAAAGSLSVEWYNPRTGTYTGRTTVTGGGSRTFTAPDGNDWVLHISDGSGGTADLTPPLPPTNLRVL